VLGVAAPKPFYLRTRNGLQELIGYTSATAADIQRAVQLSLGTSGAAAALGAESLVIKTMPDNWRAGERFSFETRVAPVLRSRAQELGRYVEVDAADHPQCCGATRCRPINSAPRNAMLCVVCCQTCACAVSCV
jgi:hypothetical protein